MIRVLKTFVWIKYTSSTCDSLALSLAPPPGLLFALSLSHALSFSTYLPLVEFGVNVSLPGLNRGCWHRTTSPSLLVFLAHSLSTWLSRNFWHRNITFHFLVDIGIFLRLFLFFSLTLCLPGLVEVVDVSLPGLGSNEINIITSHLLVKGAPSMRRAVEFVPLIEFLKH